MRKPYLLIAGSGYYPESGTGDWVGTFATRQEAEAQVTIEEEQELFSRGPRKGQIKATRKREFIMKDGYKHQVDWYEVVDLDDWVGR